MKTSNTKIVPVYIDADGLKIFDSMDKNVSLYPGTHTRVYSPMATALLKTPVFKNTIKEAIRKNFAHGGHVSFHDMRQHGRYGDTHLAMVPEDLAKAMDDMMGPYASRNPNTGRREYFLGALAGLLPTLGGMAMRAAPMVGSALKALPGALNGGLTIANNAMQAGMLGMGLSDMIQQRNQPQQQQQQQQMQQPQYYDGYQQYGQQQASPQYGPWMQSGPSYMDPGRYQNNYSPYNSGGYNSYGGGYGMGRGSSFGGGGYNDYGGGYPQNSMSSFGYGGYRSPYGQGFNRPMYG